MAIEQSNMGNQFQIDADSMRNAPTPTIGVKSEELELDCLFDFGPMQPNQTIVFGQAGASSSNQAYSDQFGFANTQALQSNLTYTFNPFMDSSFSPNAAHLYADEPVSGRESVVSKLSTRKDKCMSRNAIAARENREKKKHETKDLRERVATLEQENARYKKKYSEAKETCKK